jgi:serine/threonine protein phosphatase PrpC
MEVNVNLDIEKINCLKDKSLYSVFLVMASDGLWDTHTNEEVVDRVRRSIRHR